MIIYIPLLTNQKQRGIITPKEGTLNSALTWIRSLGFFRGEGDDGWCLLTQVGREVAL